MTASFTYQVERYQDKDGKLLSYSQILSTFEYKVINLEVKGKHYSRPGVSYGLPENCFPDESETEIISVIGPNNEDWSNLLSDAEELEILELIQDNESIDHLDIECLHDY